LPLPSAVVAFVSRCDVTGNLVQNLQLFDWIRSEDRLFWSLLVVPGVRPAEDLPDDKTALVTAYLRPPLVAVMSNVFKGWPVLPSRLFAAPVAPPLDSWLFLNTVSF
jgi:hypothetical protein